MTTKQQLNTYIDPFYESTKEARCDLMKRVNIKPEDIRKNIEDTDFFVEGLSRTTFVEVNLKPPLMVACFYHLVETLGRPISQDEFVDAYIEQHLDHLFEKGLYEDAVHFVEGRLKRTFASLQQELYVQSVLYHSGEFDGVYYNIDLDVKNKVDVLVKKNGKYLGIDLFVDTARSKKRYNEKSSNKDLHFRGINIKPAKFLLKRSESKKIQPRNGQEVWMYDEEKLVAEVKKMVEDL